MRHNFRRPAYRRCTGRRTGTWADASWAIYFYQRHGFRLIPPTEKDRVLKKYWSIPTRQIETSVVLADSTPPTPVGESLA